MNHKNEDITTSHSILWDLVQDQWKPNDIFGHGIDHAQRTYQLGKSICKLEKGNFLIVGAACYLMDSGLNVHEGREGHIERSIKIASNVLPRIPELSSYQSAIIDCIINHDAGDPFTLNTSFDAKIVRDCDTLDRMGFPGIRMTLTYGTWINRQLYCDDDPFCTGRKYDLDGFTLDYIQYLFELQEWLTTETAKLIAAKKLEQMNQFNLELKKQMSHKSVDYEDAFLLVKNLQDELGDMYGQIDD